MGGVSSNLKKKKKKTSDFKSEKQHGFNSTESGNRS